jgi:hypothetical protein
MGKMIVNSKFKLGHCEIQLRPLGVKTGQYPISCSLHMCRIDMLRGARDVDRRAAEALRAAAGQLRWQFAAGFPLGVFPGDKSPLPPVCLKVGFTQPRQQRAPGSLKTASRLFERRRNATGAITPMRHRIEAATPTPLILVDGHAGSDTDRADLHVAEIDVPAFFAGFRTAAAGEGGHALLKLDGSRQATVAAALPTETPPDRRRKFTVVEGGPERGWIFNAPSSWAWFSSLRPAARRPPAPAARL